MSTMLFSSSSVKRKEELLPLFLLNITCPSITLSFISGVTLLKRIPISESCGFIPPFPLLSLPAHYSMEGSSPFSFFHILRNNLQKASQRFCNHDCASCASSGIPICASFISKQFSPIKVVTFLYPHNFSKKI